MPTRRCRVVSFGREAICLELDLVGNQSCIFLTMHLPVSSTFNLEGSRLMTSLMSTILLSLAKSKNKNSDVIYVIKTNIHKREINSKKLFTGVFTGSLFE